MENLEDIRGLRLPKTRPSAERLTKLAKREGRAMWSPTPV
jgi:hypothetical protein